MTATDPTTLTLAPLSDPTSLREYLLKIDDTTQLSDDAALKFISQASGAIRGYCGWHITGPMDMTIELLPTGGQELYLPTKWLTNLSEMRIGQTGAWTVVDPARYQWFADGTVNIAEGFVFPRSRFDTYGFPYMDPYYTYNGGILLPKIEVDITHGFADVPEVVRAACNQIAALASSNPSGVQSRTVGMTSTRYGTRNVAAGFDVTPAENLLASYVVGGTTP